MQPAPRCGWCSAHSRRRSETSQFYCKTATALVAYNFLAAGGSLMVMKLTID
jgi:hypothetical protein